MSDVPRALLTSGERDALRGDEDMDDNTRGSHLSRVRRKMAKMRKDARILREHAPELARQLEDAVCREEMEERLDHMEDRIREVEERLDAIEDGEGGA